MIVSILRRWRLFTSLALGALAIMMVMTGVIASASAHKAQFHFWGRAVALEDNSIVLPDWACDTGPLASLDGTALNVDTGHCIPVFGQNATFGSNELGDDLFGFGPGSGIVGAIATGDFADATVKSDNTRHEGHVLSVADVQGLTVFLLNPTSTRDEASIILLQTSTFSVVGQRSEIKATAEAECETNKDDIPSADARAKVRISGLKVLSGDTNHGVAKLFYEGDVNESFPIFNVVVFGITGTEQIILNEEHVFADGGYASITVKALHLILTNAQGTVIVNLIVAQAFAGIHCGRTLPNDDAIGA